MQACKQAARRRVWGMLWDAACTCAPTVQASRGRSTCHSGQLLHISKQLEYTHLVVGRLLRVPA